MIGWSGRRKALTVLLFISPTLLGVLAFSVYPILFNVYISLTNRNQFHPNPDCTEALNPLLEPTCWAVFKQPAPPPGPGKSPVLSTPFHIQSPFYSNYADLMGQIFTPDGLQALLRVVIVLLPLVVAQRLNQRFAKQSTPPVSSGVVWLGALAIALVLALGLNLSGAYDTLSSSGDFVAVMVLTILYVVLCIPLFFIVGLTLALILNSPHIKNRALFRVIMVVPWAASTMAIMMSLVWQFFFRGQGTINQLLGILGIKGPVFLNDPAWSFLIIVLVNVWYSFPFFMVVILGALQAIPGEQYEAAEIDGAGWWKQLTSITIPLLRPAVLPMIVLSSITTFQMFDTVWAITQGGPTRGANQPGATELVMVYGYRQVFQLGAYGRIGALAVIMFILLFAATLYSLQVTRITKGAYE